MNFDWIDLSSGLDVRPDEREAQAKHGPRACAAPGEAQPLVEHYLTREGTVIRLENAQLCDPLDHAILFE